MVRVLVFATSVQRQQQLRALIDAAPPLHVTGSAGLAEDAVELATRRRADVIVLDQGGSPPEALACTRRLMQARATPIVVVAAATEPRESRQAFALLEAGAMAVVGDPGDGSGPEQRRRLDEMLDKIRLMAELKVVRRWAPTPGQPAATVAPAPSRPQPAAPRAPARRPVLAPSGARRRFELVAIGASTGGPVALKQLLGSLPADFPLPIVVVQHMAGGFVRGMAEWLARSCALKPRIAEPGDLLQAGWIHLAPDGAHLSVEPSLRLAFDTGALVNGHRPAVARLLGSVATHFPGRAIGILLTGMGKDGAAELKLMRDSGSITFAQDAASSVVHGMPGEAIRCGGADYVMAPEAIGAALPGMAGWSL
ncbi:chemotaxis protein CheB [Ramlibacter sp.]|uniref:chemotaxis protein CheB n=1 Tax=Ramlibacter sp. TaxID=1917967 RepID=UPI002D379FAA|nr:chemotaxis protein CheB [Ramlibacter sp.]HYD75528.1 chemotaxis protein CheB [Ramlibacter sp.]